MVVEEACWDFWIDTGGTFTDCLALDPDGKWHRVKVLSSSTLRTSIEDLDTRKIKTDLSEVYPDDFFVGFEVQAASGNYRSRVTGYDTSTRTLIVSHDIDAGLTRGDLLVLHFDGEAPELGARVISGTPGNKPLPPSRLRLATTRGTNALLERKVARTVLFINEGLGDLLRINTQQRPDLFDLNICRPEPLYEAVVEVPINEDTGEIITNELLPRITSLLKQGIDSAAVCLMHAYQDASQESKLSAFLKTAGFETIVSSYDCAPFIRILPRAETTLVDAALSPILNRYLDRIESQFGRDGLSVMTSAGGLVSRETFRAKDSLFSGPAGGVVGAVDVGSRAGYDKIIGFDMGGTSTDVTRYSGALAYQFETRVGDARVMAPSLKIETVAAGGGSICQFDGERLRVGPESAGASPGPACYGTGGPLTVTDVNLLLGRMDSDQFGIPVDQEDSHRRLKELGIDLGIHSEKEEHLLLSGLLEIANENMADAIRKVSTGEGYDPAEYALVAFGGAGGQHACGIAEKLNMKTILIPEDAGLLSAAGLSRAVLEAFAERQLLCSFSDWEETSNSVAAELVDQALLSLKEEDRLKASLSRLILSMRLVGQETTLDIDAKEGACSLELFEKNYQATFGYEPDLTRVEVVSVRAVVATPHSAQENESFPDTNNTLNPEKQLMSFSAGKWMETNVYNRDKLASGDLVLGPAIIQDPFSTLFIDTDWQGRIGSQGTLRLENCSSEKEILKTSREVEIELFSNRFQSLVEEMGVRLKRTAVSTNVRDRLDFSCGLLDDQGGLVVNAPHIPVHLGALGMCVRTLSKTHTWAPGEMVVTNHPGVGGSHLPDVTIVCPVFSDTDALIGFLVNRAHHAELGGVSPGSMPPAARSLAEEGVVVSPTIIMREGVLDLSPVESLLKNGPYPSRRVEENLSDLKAQVASNLKGKNDLEELLQIHGASKVTGFMNGIQSRAEASLRHKLSAMTDGEYRAKQKLDDGTPIEVNARVAGDSLTLSFSDGGGVHPGNYNATPGIVFSAVVYFLRVWLNQPMPLNEGLLRPVTIDIPNGLLNPPFPEDPAACPPVVAGNVETSQRLVDTLLLAFEVVACSQGTMNNLIFGNEKVSFYETIAGGAGAGNGFDGESGIHTHMTNTGITDPEILEYRYPVKLRQFALRNRSGGDGKYSGGDGVIRELEFTESVTLSLLTQHRKEQPYGLCGGQPGQAGEQRLLRKGEDPKSLDSAVTVDLQAGDRLRMLTPGGGGWGVS